MKKRMVLVSLLTTILMLAFFSSAYALAPSIETFEILDEVVVIDCGGFDAIFVDDINIRITTYFDKDGSPNGFQAQVTFDGTVTHSETGQSFRDHAINNFSGQLPFDERNETQRGVSLHITVPGEGLVALRVGRIILDEEGMPTFVSGQNMDRFYGDIVCEGLSNLE
jgi:hypothetical protein